MLESRLDNTVYRLGLAATRNAARQLISHKHFLVNNNVVNIPSYLLSNGDIIQVRDKSKRFRIFQDSMRRIQGDNPVPWLSIDKSKLNGNQIELKGVKTIQSGGNSNIAFICEGI